MTPDDTEDDFLSPVKLSKRLVEGEHDPEWCTRFLPSSTKVSSTCWKELCLCLEDEFGLSYTEDSSFKRMVTAQDLLNIYYVYTNFPDTCPDKHAIYLWIENMHRPRNLCDEVSKFCDYILN